VKPIDCAKVLKPAHSAEFFAISVFANTLHPPLQVVQNSQPKHSVLDLLCAKGGEVKDIVINQMQSTEAQLSSNAYILEVAQHNRSRTECFGCEFWTTCKGGCRVLANTDIAKNSAECAGFKTFLNYVKGKVHV
jgi:radical SAM protein with 4Fe4S-binding SPASM domain